MADMDREMDTLIDINRKWLLLFGAIYTLKSWKPFSASWFI